MRRVRRAGFSILALCTTTPFAVRAQSSVAATGRIEGVATISSSLTASRQRVRVYDEPGTPPPKPPGGEPPLANVVLYLEAAAPLAGILSRQAALPPALHQHEERFTPHVLPVRVGAKVEFPNDDPIFHNVFSLSRAKAFDLGRYPQGSSKSVLFSKPGVVQVFCHIHADMSGYVLVLDNPFFVTPDADGRFSLAGVPPGDYTLIAWHERIRPMATPVHVEAGRTSTLTLRIPILATAANP